jgi:hypothetical protein
VGASTARKGRESRAKYSWPAFFKTWLIGHLADLSAFQSYAVSYLEGRKIVQIMDFSSQALRRGEVVIWSGSLEKQRHDAATRPAPPVPEEHKPRMCRTRDESADVGEFKLSDERVIRSLRRKWGIGL